uniref:Jacalin-type lectin domain-containing protein n=1 Tax=Triticum aestivum TaxID=4565 RepID=A0A077RTK2_WHEAT|nr:unnamed protein product [Triticum aestivum]
MVEPVCLNSITIRSGKTLLAIAFSYSDKHGKPHHAGPWGANGGQLIGSSFHTILLGPSEHLIQISGTVDMNIEHSTDVITSITFTTNMSVYGPFGTREGLPFRSKLVSNGSIVGFFVRAMCLIDAIGIYVKPEREPMEKQGLITKTGPWGGYNGYLYDVDVSPRRLIVLGRSEYLKEISGTVGPSPHPDIVMSLLFVTNIGSYGPFGGGGGTTFCSPELKNGSIIGFFAHAGQNVDAIGVYVDAIKEKENDGVACANPKLQGDVMDLDKRGEVWGEGISAGPPRRRTTAMGIATVVVSQANHRFVPIPDSHHQTHLPSDRQSTPALDPERARRGRRAKLQIQR